MGGVSPDPGGDATMPRAAASRASSQIASRGSRSSGRPWSTHHQTEEPRKMANKIPMAPWFGFINADIRIDCQNDAL